jgi:cytochrome c
VLLAKASAAKGENDVHACQTCHNFEKGAGVKIGPPLYGVVGRPIASVPGFDYSSALKGKGGNWTYDKLFVWIAAPSEWAPGTKMAFAGEEDPHKRADILAYLRTLSDSPVPFPKPAATASAAPASGAAPSSAAAPSTAGAGPAGRTPPQPTPGHPSAAPSDSAK